MQIPGDFNLNGIVDASDFIVWRDGLGDRSTQADLQDWIDNLGVRSSSFCASTVPEPRLCVFLVGVCRADFVAHVVALGENQGGIGVSGHFGDQVQAKLSHFPRIHVGIFLLGLADKRSDCLLLAALDVFDHFGVGVK